MLRTAVVLCVAALCCLSPFCQAFPQLWSDELAREEEGRVAAVDVLRSVARALIEQNSEGECPLEIFNFTGTAELQTNKIYHIVLVDNKPTRVLIGESLDYKCKDNYRLYVRKNGKDFERATKPNVGVVNEIKYECRYASGATYQPSINAKGEPGCIPLCPELNDLENGYVRVTRLGLELLVGSTANYSCQDGYQLQGSQTRTCGEDGQWSGQEPTCIPLCPWLQGIANGVVHYTSRQPGGTATYSCDPGYVLQGAETRTCGQDGSGEWSGQEPSCIPLCPELQDITNGAVSYINRQPGATVSYSCNSGYQLSGTQTRTCGEDGQWSGQEPSCIPQCPELQGIANGVVYYTSRQPGDTATYSCDPGYVLRGARTRTCGQDGEWSSQEPRCVSLCPVLPAPPNGAVNYGNREPGDVATYTCRHGYRLVGPEMRICARDQAGKWSGIHSVCEIIRCPLVNSIPNGDIDADNSPIGGGYPVNTVVTYTCDNDYQLRGEDTLICLRSGEWDHPEPSCRPLAAKCPELRLSGNPRSVYKTRRQIKRDRPRDYKVLLIKTFFEKNIVGNPVPYDEGSEAYLTCVNGWKLMPNSPSVQTCVRNSITGELYWTKPGICVYRYSITRPALTGGTG